MGFERLEMGILYRIELMDLRGGGFCDGVGCFDEFCEKV